MNLIVTVYEIYDIYLTLRLGLDSHCLSNTEFFRICKAYHTAYPDSILGP